MTTAGMTAPEITAADKHREAARELRLRGRPPPTVIVLRLRLPPGPAGVRGLRWLLKAALRRFGMKCLEIREEA